MSNNWRPDKQTVNPREFVDVLDLLIKNRVLQTRAIPGTAIFKKIEENCEIYKRDLTDYLLVNSKEAGVYARGEHD